MNLAFSAVEEAFRSEVREFLRSIVPGHWLSRVRTGLRLEPEELIQYQKGLAGRGWGAPSWPEEHGGNGWTATQQYIFACEAADMGAPIQFHQGLELIGPIIFTYGTESQKARYLPAIINADDWWCQGYSEPGAGSDLASLKTSAVREGDHYVLNGQKTWTSYAHVASHMFVLVRTSREERKHQGISMLLVDMTTNGITIRPIVTMDGKHHTNEVFLDDVRVHTGQLVGEEGRGWEYGKVLLDRERMVTASSAIHLRQMIEGVREAAADGFGDQLAQLEIEATALEMMVKRTMADAAAGVDSGPRGSMVKLLWSRLYQDAMSLWLKTLGPEVSHYQALDYADVAQGMPHVLQGALYSRVTSIYGGSSEIQHNIIARRALGL